MKKNQKQGKFGKWLIFSVASIFAVYASVLLLLQVFGTNIQAHLTSYRQEFGERNETIRNQYTYEFGYEFIVDGKTYSGTGQRVSSSVFLKPGPEATISVNYLKCCPFVNLHNDGRKTSINILISYIVALVLFLFFRKM